MATSKKTETDEVRHPDEVEYREDRPGATADAGVEEVQDKVDEASERGYIGFVPDPTPNENYTLSGVNQDMPTPETDPDLAQQAHEMTTPRPFQPNHTALQAARARGTEKRRR